jgi:hypothetical protein
MCMNYWCLPLVEHFNFFTPSFSGKLPLFFTQEVHLKMSEKFKLFTVLL